MAGEANEELLRKGQAVNTEKEREQRLENGERNEQKDCNVEDREIRDGGSRLWKAERHGKGG